MVLTIFANPTTEAHWQSSTNTRGTSDLLQTCIITLSLCAYSALHLNVAVYWVSFPKILYISRKAVWIIVTLLCPEAMVLAAWHDRRCAKEALNKASAVTTVKKKSWRSWFGWKFRKPKSVGNMSEGGHKEVVFHFASLWYYSFNNQAANTQVGCQS